jgi:hypothetical protein
MKVLELLNSLILLVKLSINQLHKIQLVNQKIKKFQRKTFNNLLILFIMLTNMKKFLLLKSIKAVT